VRNYACQFLGQKEMDYLNSVVEKND